MAIGALQHDRADITSIGNGIKSLHDSADDGVIHGITLVRSVNGDGEHTGALFYQQIFCRWKIHLKPRYAKCIGIDLASVSLGANLEHKRKNFTGIARVDDAVVPKPGGIGEGV